MNTQLDYQTLIERLSYNPETGLFKYKIQIAQMLVGELAGRPNTNGHIQISINRKRYMAHNLAWFYMTEEWPSFIIDHEDRNYTNNKWANLRPSNLSLNQGNRKLNANNTSGFKGVCWVNRNQKWCAQISIHGNRKFLGYFNTPEEAFEIYKSAAIKHFGEFASW